VLDSSRHITLSYFFRLGEVKRLNGALHSSLCCLSGEEKSLKTLTTGRRSALRTRSTKEMLLLMWATLSGKIGDNQSILTLVGIINMKLNFQIKILQNVSIKTCIYTPTPTHTHTHTHKYTHSLSICAAKGTFNVFSLFNQTEN
jgi:hypothetical protein